MPCVSCRDLEEHHQASDMLSIDPIDMDREIRSAAFGEGACRRPLLDVYQLAERVAAEVGQLLHVGEALWDRDIGGAFLYGEESQRLVLRTFHEELDLTVLIRRAQRR